MRAAPNVDLVIHVVEVGRVAECRGQRGGPLVAVDAALRIVRARLIEERDIGVVGIGGECRAAIGFQSVAGVGVEWIDAALRAILRDGEAPVAVRSVFRALGDPGQHDHCHQRMTARVFHVGDELGGISVADLGVVEVLEVPVVGRVVGEELPVVARG